MIKNILLWPLNSNIAFNDAPIAWQFGFQDPATAVAEGIIDLHHHIFFFLILVAVFVGWLLFTCVSTFNTEKMVPSFMRLVAKMGPITHGDLIEIIWTLAPAFILLFIALPSFSLLYAMDELTNPSVTLKAIGNQWYWSYEYSDYAIINGEAKDTSYAFDSYMIPEDELEDGQLRLLEVDNPVILPTNTHIRIIITASDVLHSWAVPSLGVKVDAVPGRLSQVPVFIKREGVFYGQCSEICGVNHGFMPIVVKAVSLDKYISFLVNKSEA